MNKKSISLIVLIIIVNFSINFSTICLADNIGDPIQYFSVEAGTDSASFLITRVKDVQTGNYVHTDKIGFSYIIRCEDNDGNTIKKYEGGSGSLPAGKNQATIDISDITAEMKEQLDKYDPIYIWMEITKADNAGCISDEAINLTGKTLHDALSSMEGLSEKDIKDIEAYVSEAEKQPAPVESGESVEPETSYSSEPAQNGEFETSYVSEPDQAGEPEASYSDESDQSVVSGNVSGNKDISTNEMLKSLFSRYKTAIFLVIGALILIAVIAIIAVIIYKRKKQFFKK